MLIYMPRRVCGQLFGPLLEALVLIDRLLYLRELGHTAALVPLFDPSLSPRSYALVAVKSGGGMGGEGSDEVGTGSSRCWPCADEADERWADALWNV